MIDPTSRRNEFVPTSRRTARRAALRAASIAAGCTLILQLYGCETNRAKADATVVRLPDQYRTVLPEQAHVDTLRTSGGQDETNLARDPNQRPVNRPWWQALDSSELNRLMDRALANNQDLRIAQLQLAQAKIRANQVVAGGKPRISAPLQAAVQAPGGTVGSVPVPGSSKNVQRSYQTSLQGQWRLDVWGEQRAIENSSELQVWRALYDRDNAQRNLVGSLTSAYVSYLIANDSLRLARDNEAIGRNIVQATELRLGAGDATMDELEQKRASQHVLEEVVPGLELQREEARNNIAYLVATVPSELDLSDAGTEVLTLPEIPKTMPSALLLQRPDIRGIEARMRAADADIEVARARLLPPIDLSAQAGFTALTLTKLLQPQSLFWTGLTGLAVNIFDGGKKEKDKAYSEAYYQEMIETYARTVLQAVREVEGALGGLRGSAIRLTSQQRATRSALNQYKMSSSAYQLGALDLTSLLESRRNYQRYIEDEQRLKGDYLKSYVNLHHALGTQNAREFDQGLAKADDVELFAEDAAARFDRRRWQVRLSGLYHQTNVPSVWNDLKTRYPTSMQGHALRAILGDYVGERDGAREAWYQLFVTRFEDRASAERFCADIRLTRQQCEPIEATGRQQANSSSESWTREQQVKFAN
jgi:NodT family efflux transporter outer membrane factor (OMF) lipoprotein